ncbi:hypothetical protein [Pseudoxanthomonas sp. Root630]|uniref:hypothetical protein n=1 Tax=Pseudoxanthomonas sp. Root630 TaxID=1736574 RepID=UPI0012DC3EF0|nr:hypothetical protein [Pseudoxanthomonas sp. Root630]
MIVSYVLAVMISSSDAKTVPGDCLQNSWPTNYEVSQSVTFAELQDIYLREVPGAFMSQQTISRAESVARHRGQENWKAQAEAIGDAVYITQLHQIEARCGSSLDAEHGAAGLIEQAYARVLAHTNLRHDAVAAGALLPEHFSVNLTPRIAIVGLSVHCSGSTPALASFLARASIPCGQLQGAKDGR